MSFDAMFNRIERKKRQKAEREADVSTVDYLRTDIPLSLYEMSTERNPCSLGQNMQKPLYYHRRITTKAMVSQSDYRKNIHPREAVDITARRHERKR